MNELSLVLPVIFGCAIVQSLFGVGLLVFGTPLLLLLGFSFSATLGWLLPASLAVSLVQAWEGRAVVALPGRFFAWSLPPLALGLALVLGGVFRPDLLLFVGVLLVGTAVLRQSSTARAVLQKIFRHQTRVWIALTGLVHGLSNLGGGPLVILLASWHAERRALRANVALVYLVFSSIQLAVLAMLSPAALSPVNLLAPVISLSAYGLCGNRCFRAVSEGAYQRLLAGFTLSFGLALLARRFI